MAPIIGAAFKMVVPFIVILPGLLALAVLPFKLTGEDVGPCHRRPQLQRSPAPHAARYCGPGLLGLGITALIAGFMSGMAGNVSAFATVWTYDIYRAYIKKDATDAHYVSMGRWCTILGVLVTIGTAYMVMQFQSIMDYVQALFSFFIAPLFGTVLLGMLWKRATPPAASGACSPAPPPPSPCGPGSRLDPSALRYIALSANAKDMAENMYRALWSWLICVAVTVVVSLLTKPKPDTELNGLVYGCTELPEETGMPLWHKPPSGRLSSPSSSSSCRLSSGKSRSALPVPRTGAVLAQEVLVVQRLANRLDIRVDPQRDRRDPRDLLQQRGVHRRLHRRSSPCKRPVRCHQHPRSRQRIDPRKTPHDRLPLFNLYPRQSLHPSAAR